MLGRFAYLTALLTVALSMPAYFVAYQANRSLHFGIGRLDGGFLADKQDFYPPLRMEGPERGPDGSVTVRDFTARLTKLEARLILPYHALRTPVQIDVRCHRFGLEGTVSLEVNGEHLQDFVFSAGSYPWGGIRAVIPQEMAERGPLAIELRTRGGSKPPSHLPEDLGLGVDFIELTPLSRGSVLLPTMDQWVGFLLLLVVSSFFVRFVGGGIPAMTPFLLVVSASTVILTVLNPVLTAQALSFAWLFFPGLALLIRLAELLDWTSQG